MTSVTGTALLIISLAAFAGLTAVAGYALYQTRHLSLPIPQVFGFAAVFLPLITFISTQLILPRVRDQATVSRNAVSVVLLSALQLIYENIIATLSLTYIFPGCSLEDKWKELYRNKNAEAIRGIQDRFNCCGFNSLRDRPWPFPSGRPGEGHGDDQCKRTYGRVRSCRGPWEQEDKINAGLFFTVAAFILVAIVVIIRLKSRNRSSGWFSFFETPFNNGQRHGNGLFRGYIDDGEQGQAVEPYRDDINGGGGTNPANTSDGRFTVQPSGLVSDSAERWQDDNTQG